ncbi:ribbon-helix-helix protein, CopG family [Rhizobium sp. BK176]|uniref:ribbon-helix-helix protein, CopG family n=1 Tax=Rhizobium sp. BK176 TaxID=2587071 RepID=UPI00216A6406|nr:ribbon-helix-helix protein, CopG family [Rhizobium sp. BK176]MCS4088603.1 tRNA threonylcarbamoyladenosine modification (KEOPS) complex Pcc1 subunit [Rhizobium sp. BK176]
MHLAENDNAATLTLVTNEETVARYRALRKQLDVESDAELVDLALEARDHSSLRTAANATQTKMATSLSLTLPRETLATLAEERMRTGKSYEETIREALRMLASLALSEPAFTAIELAS